MQTSLFYTSKDTKHMWTLITGAWK